MPTIDDYRAKYPSLRDLDDDALIGRVAEVQGVDQGDVIAHMGYKPKPRGAIRGLADLGVEAVSGVSRGVKFTADAFGAGNPVSGAADAVDKFARDYLSAQAKQDDAKIAEIMAASEDAGIWDQVKSAAQAFAQAPFRTAVNALGTSVPTIAAAMIPGVAQAGAAARLGMLGTMGAAQGAGVVKGSIYERVRAEQMKQPGMTPDQAEAAAVRAQEYGGENADNILGGIGLGAAASATGAQPIIAKLLQGKAAQEVARGAERGMLARTALGVAAEAPLEAAQGGQEQFAGNVALQRQGFDTPTWRGVAGQAAMEGIAAAGPGGIAGALDRPNRAAPPVVDPADAQRRLAEAPDVASMVQAANDLAMAPLDYKAPGFVPPAQDLSLVPTGQGADGIPFEADPRFAGGSIVRSGQRAPQVERFSSKQQADIAIGERGLLGQVNPVQIGPNAWVISETIEPESLTIPTGEATELSTPDAAEQQARANIAKWMTTAKPVDEARASELVKKATELGKGDFAVIPHTAGGFTVVPKAWMTPGMADRLMAEQRAAQWPDGRIPAPEAAELIPTGEVIEGEARKPRPIPTGRAAEIDAEVIQADDFLTGDGQPYGTQSGAVVRAKREGLTPAEVVKVAGGWVVRPQPTGLGTAVDGRPNNTRGTTAADVLRGAREPVADVPRTAGMAVGAADERAPDGMGGGGTVRPQPDGNRGSDATAQAPASGGRTAAPAGSGSQPDPALTPGARVNFDGKTWTVIDASPSMIRLDDGQGTRRAISSTSAKWKQVTPAEPSRPVEAGPGTADATPVAQPAGAAISTDALKQNAGPTQTPAAPAIKMRPGFDGDAWQKDRDDRIKASRDSGNVHLDKVPAYVETMRGKLIYSVHDQKVTGTIRTVDNRGNVYINWSDDYSAQKEMASPVREGKRTVMQTSLGPRDLKDYAVGAPAATTTTDAKPTTSTTRSQAPATAAATEATGRVPDAAGRAVEADGVAADKAVDRADVMGLKGQDRRDAVAQDLSLSWGMTTDEVRESDAFKRAVSKAPRKAATTKANERAVEAMSRQGLEAAAAGREADGLTDPFKLDKTTLNRELDKIVTAGEAGDLIGAFLVLRRKYEKASGKKSIPPAASRALMLPDEPAEVQPGQAQGGTTPEGAGGSRPTLAQAPNAAAPVEAASSSGETAPGAVAPIAPYYVKQPGTGRQIPVPSPEAAAEALGRVVKQSGAEPVDGSIDVFDAKTGLPAFNVRPDGTVNKVETLAEARARSEQAAGQADVSTNGAESNTSAERVQKTPETVQVAPLKDRVDARRKPAEPEAAAPAASTPADATGRGTPTPAGPAPEPKPKRPPKSFRKKVKVSTDVFVEDSGKFEPREVDADTALKALDDDIAEMTAFRLCITGG